MTIGNREDNGKLVKVKTCGKLYIAGEYAVLISGHSAVVKNVNIYMEAKIKFSNNYKIYSDMYGYSVSLEKNEDYSLIQETVNIVNEYLYIKAIKTFPFELNIMGKMENNGKKYGIGSSGSVVILVIKAMIKLYKLKISKEEVFKLSSYILLKRGDNGSMGDLACITYESLIVYTSFDRGKVSTEIEKKSLGKIMDMDWGYSIEKLKCKEKYEFLVGWTKKPSISKDMINHVKKSINEKFLENSDRNVRELVKGIKTGNCKMIGNALDKGGKLLKNLDKSIYSNELEKLVKASDGLDIFSKSSGAGGGDCGIAVSFNKNDTEILIERWKKENIDLLYSSEL
ncbi:phosphomevalonate kinase [Leptotrichia sp. OH3620_COT-345]|uniref:phosphomevalonate kinase n=1 Tax=Leptotrichia sp. OH3620_COT-345 TaxID=2491048 RepID=UPI000F654088|nr:phosphomevalonate kinase [Leptotrichia sp. OH3620_COT-345]RRD39365.1 phosphomevalonate kinase [Leptotrichia sp. OH3620_COT-345]